MWIADRFKWTLEYVDSLDVTESYKLIEVVQNGDTAHAQNQKKAMKHRGGR